MRTEQKKFNDSQYYKKIQTISKLAIQENYSYTPEPQLGFNYRVSKKRYSLNDVKQDNQKKIKIINKSMDIEPASQQQKIKLTTILQTQNPNALFPKIVNPDKDRKASINKPKRHLYKSLIYTDHHNTQTTRQKSMLTLQSHISADQAKQSALNQCLDINKYSREAKYSQMAQQYHQSMENMKQSKFSIYSKNSESHQNRYNINTVAQNEEQQENQQEQEFIKGSNPGPGYYSYSYSDFDKASLGKRSTKASFLSALTRFPAIKQDKSMIIQQERVQNLFKIQLQKRRENKLKNRYKKISIPFNAKSPRQFSYDLNSNSKGKQQTPGPQDYSPRFGEQLIHKIQRNFKSSFGCSIDRFQPQQTIKPHLGPGCYQQSRLTDLTQGNLNYYFKSCQPRFKP